MSVGPPPRGGASQGVQGGGGGGTGTGGGALHQGNTAPSLPPSRLSLTPLQTLLQMGFPRHRAIKALAATGNRSVQLASDWLLTHVNDTSLDEDIPREYILYACPTGPLLEQLREFWSKSKEVCGWNGAHNYMPHITLVSFFKAPDECSLQLSKALKHVMESIGEPPSDFVALEPYISPNFMGLFVSEEHAEYLKKVAIQYVKQVSTSIGLTVDTYEQLDALATCFPWCAMPQERPQPSICLEPHVKSLHITLAYQFSSNSYSTLKSLAEHLHPLEKGSWELRLYSRDSRLSNHQVHKVKHTYASRENDELELRLGDYIHIEEKALHNSPDGWVQGMSWLTGMSGYLPGVYTERTAESDSWTLHRAIPLLQNAPVYESNKYVITNTASENESLCQSEGDVTEVDGHFPGVDTDGISVATMPLPNTHNSEDPLNEWTLKMTYSASHVDSVLSKSGLHSEYTDAEKRESVAESNGSNTDNVSKEEETEESENVRDILVMRHGERVDFTFGTWVPYCFDEDDNYIRKDMNMPPSLPKRSGGSAAYSTDCPLTMVGLLQARLVGEGLKLAKVNVVHLYSSPSYRCIQTAQAMLEGLDAEKPPKIRIEPTLFEWLVWYPKGPPTFMKAEELLAAGFNVDVGYKPFMNMGEPPFIQTEEEAECLEDCSQFYERSAKFVKDCVTKTENEGGIIMLVGHASTLDTAWRGISDLPARDGSSLSRLMQGVPYCSLACFRGPPWRLVPPPCPPLMNTSNKRYDWKLLSDD